METWVSHQTKEQCLATLIWCRRVDRGIHPPGSFQLEPPGTTVILYIIILNRKREIFIIKIINILFERLMRTRKNAAMVQFPGTLFFFCLVETPVSMSPPSPCLHQIASG